MNIKSILYWCPDELGPVWWVPLVRAGYPVYLASQQYLSRFPVPPEPGSAGSVGPSLRTCCFGLVLTPSWPERPNSLSSPPFADLTELEQYAGDLAIPFVYVSSDIDANGILGRRGSYWIRVRGSHEMGEALIRILLASGCLCCWEMKGCKRFYLASREVSQGWPEFIHLPDVEIYVEKTDTVLTSDFPASGKNRNGRLDCGSISIQMFSGEGFDVRSNQDTPYLAIDYRKRAFGSRALDRLISGVDLNLAHLAAICVDKLHIPRE